MKNSKRLLLVDDHPLFRQGLKSLIFQSLPDSDIHQAGSISEARDEILEFDFSAVILDVSLPDGDGISFAEELLETDPGLRIFILSMHHRSGMVLQARKIGCRGYFLKEGDGSHLIRSLISEDGSFQTSPELSDSPECGDEDITQLYARLTRREKEVFRLLAMGSGYKEVAWNLGISSRTASVHRYNIFQKLQISTEIELLHLARDVGLID